MSSREFVLATRKSPLAMAQAELARSFLSCAFSTRSFSLLPIVTTGDRKKNWSLADQGGKGLFVKELEEALLSGRADLAIHSAKDLPTDMDERLVLAGYLPREAANDVLAIHPQCRSPRSIASGSPRRRAQISRLFSSVTWLEIRGNVGTRLAKIERGEADGTVLALAGLKRLGLGRPSRLVYLPLTLEQSVPAAGQGAIALQCRREDASEFSDPLDRRTAYDVTLERAILAELGGGCQVACGVWVGGRRALVYHEDYGFSEFPLETRGMGNAAKVGAAVVAQLNLRRP